jgi:hypothetical protein
MQPLAEFLRTYAFFREVILIADACREQIDFAPNTYFTRKAQPNKNTSKVRRFDAYPCQVGAKTKETTFGDKPGGVLTNAFLTGVKGLAARKGVVRSDYLKNYMINAVEQKLGDTPEIMCSEAANAFAVAAADDRMTHLRVAKAANAPPGDVTLVDGATLDVVAVQNLEAAPLERDLIPGFYILKRPGSDDKFLRVAWETTDVEY